MSTVEIFGHETPEAILLASARLGDKDAYAELWKRHRAAAVRTARPLAFNNAEDVVSDAFLAIWQQMQQGAGPREHFRAYVLTTVRNMAVRRYHSESRVQIVAEVDGEPIQDGLIDLEAAEDRREVCDAFSTLPERWQLVLWWSEIEKLPRREVAERLSLSPNSVSALTRRAKEGLRVAWLSEALPAPEQLTHPDIAGLLPKYVRGSLSGKDRAEVHAHLSNCLSCRTVAGDITQVNSRLGGKSAGVAGLILIGGVTETARSTTAAAAAGLLATFWHSGVLPKVLLGVAVLVIGAVVWGLNGSGNEKTPPTRTAEPPNSSSRTETKPKSTDTQQDSATSPETETGEGTGTTPPENGGSSGNPVVPPPIQGGTFVASSSGPAGPAPLVSGMSSPGSSVEVAVAGMSYSVPVANDGSWSTDLANFGLGSGSYTARFTTSDSQWSPREVALPFTLSAPSVQLASPAVPGGYPSISVHGLSGVQACLKLSSGTYQVFSLNSGGSGGGVLSQAWNPGMVVQAGYCVDGRFGPMESYTL